MSATNFSNRSPGRLGKHSVGEGTPSAMTIPDVISEPLAKKIVGRYLPRALNSLFAELVLSMFFLAVFTMMLTRYWANPRGDTMFTMAVVVIASVLLYGIAGFALYMVHYMLIYNYGNVAQLLQADKFAWFPLVDGLIAITTQTFFSYRAFRLLKNSWTLLTVLIALMATTLGGVIAVCVISNTIPNQLHAKPLKIPTLIWLTSAMVTDLIITASVLYGLFKSRTGWAGTNRVIYRLVFVTLEAQVPPLCIALAWLLDFSIEPSSFTGSLFMGIRPYFYCIGLLFSLNQRIGWDTDTGMQNNGQFSRSHRSRPPVTIRVDIEEEIHESRYTPPDAKSDDEDEEKTTAFGSVSSSSIPMQKLERGRSA